MKPLALSPADQRRLEKLARDAGRTPAQTLKFVLRDGFDFCEWELREGAAADESVRLHGTVPNEVVQREARDIIAAAKARRRKISAITGKHSAKPV